ncbi:MAG: GPR1/FUN34/YaaH family transporter [Thermoleophilia bacterium]
MLAIQLWFYKADLGGPLALIFFATGIMILVSAFWAAAVGQSFVASVAGIFGGFWLSYAVFVLGVLHGWWMLDPSSVNHAVQAFAISWAAIVFFLMLISVRLPVVYTLLFFLVVLALCLVAAGYDGAGHPNILRAAGIVVFIFAAVGAWIFMAVGSVSVGGPLSPPLGRPLLRPRPRS